MNTGNLLSGTLQNGVLRLRAKGSWTAAQAGELERQLDPWLNQIKDAKEVAIELGDIGEFDTFGAWLLERVRRQVHLSGRTISVAGLPEHELQLFEKMQTVNQQNGTTAVSPDHAANPVRSALARLGHAVVDLGHDFRSFAHMTGRLTLAVLELVRHPRNFRLTSTVHQLDRVGWKAVPIILLITFLIGAIIAQQGFFHFGKFGADIYVVDMVGILVLRELGVLLVAIMVAGRSGSAFTAELGSMKMREEVDALKTMGFDPIKVLILPRVLVLIVALPMLTFLGSMAALYGGGLVAFLYGGMDPDIFITRLKEAINITHFQVGLIKAPFMGAVIAIIACMEGLKVQGSAESLGHHTTRAVVKSIFMVIVLDGLFAIFFASIGM